MRAAARTAGRVLDRLEEWLIATLIAAATGLIFVAVLHRYGTGLSIDLAKWAAARGVPVIPGVLQAIYSWLAARDLSWAQAGDHVRDYVRRGVHRRHRDLWRLIRRRNVQHRPAVERSRSADVDRLFGDPAGIRADVLPLFASGLVLLLDRRLAASQRGESRGRCRYRSVASGNRSSWHGVRALGHAAGADPHHGAAFDSRNLHRAKNRHHSRAPVSTGDHDLCAADCVHGYRHAGFDRAWTDGFDLFVHS